MKSFHSFILGVAVLSTLSFAALGADVPVEEDCCEEESAQYQCEETAETLATLPGNDRVGQRL